MASPSVAATAEGAVTTAGTTHTIAFPSGSTAGDLIVVIFAGAVASPSAWSDGFSSDAGSSRRIAWKKIDGTEGGDVAPTVASTKSSWIVYRITGAADPATQAPEIANQAGASGLNPDPPAATITGGPKDFLFIAVLDYAGQEEADDDTWCNSAPTNYGTLLQKTSGTGGANTTNSYVASAHREVTNTSSENPGTFNVDQNVATLAARTITIHPTSAVNATATPSTVAAVAAVPAPTTLAAAISTPAAVAAVAAVLAPAAVYVFGRVQQKAASPGSATVVSLTLDSTPLVGDLIIVRLQTGVTGRTWTMTGSGWNTAYDASRVAQFYKIAGASEPTFIEATISGAAANISMVVDEYAGLAQTPSEAFVGTQNDVYVSATTGDTGVGSLTTDGDQSLALANWGMGGTHGALSAFTPSTYEQDDPSPADDQRIVARRLFTADAQEASVAANWTTARSGGAGVAVYKIGSSVSATATPATVAAVGAVPASTLSGTSSVTPAVVAAVAAVPAPTAKPDTRVTPAAVAAIATVFSVGSQSWEEALASIANPHTWFKFNETGDPVVDYGSGTATDGDYSGAPTRITGIPGSTDGFAGDFGSGVSHANWGTVASKLRFTGPFSMGIWFRYDSGISGQRGIVAERGVVSGKVRFQIDFYPTFVRPQFGWNTGAAWVQATAPSDIDEPDEWHLIVGVYDGTLLRLIYDGVEIDTTTAGTQPTAGDGQWMVGKDYNFSNDWAHDIDDLFFTDEVLTESDALSLYQAGLGSGAGGVVVRGTAVASPTAVAAVGAVPAPTVEAASNATSTPSAVAAIAAVGAPTARGAAITTPAAVAAIASVPAPTVLGAARPTPAATAAVATVPAPSVVATSVVAPATVAAIASVPASTAIPDTRSSPAAVAAIAAVGAPQARGASVAAPAAVASVASVPPPTAVPDTRPAPAAVAGVAAVPAPTIRGTSVVTPAAVAAVASVPAPSARGAAVTTPPAVAAVASVPTPSIQLGGIASPAAVAAVASVPPPTVVPDTRPNPAAVAALASVPAPSVQGTAIAAPSTVPTVASVPPPSARGAAVTAPTVVAAISTVPPPSILGTAIASPTAVGAVASVPAPSTSGAAIAGPASVDASATVPAPTIAVGGAGTATPSTVAAIATITTPSVLATAVVSPNTVAGIASVPAPTLTSSSQPGPASVDAVAAVPAPAVRGTAIVAPATVVTISTVPAPTVIPETRITPATVAALSDIETPTIITDVSVTVTPATVAAIASVPAPTIIGASQAKPPVAGSAVESGGLSGDIEETGELVGAVAGASWSGSVVANDDVAGGSIAPSNWS